MATGGPTNDIYEVEELEAWLQNNEMFLRACVVVVWAGRAVVSALVAVIHRDTPVDTSSSSTGNPSKRDMTHHYSFETFAKLD